MPSYVSAEADAMRALQHYGSDRCQLCVEQGMEECRVPATANDPRCVTCRSRKKRCPFGVSTRPFLYSYGALIARSHPLNAPARPCAHPPPVRAPTLRLLQEAQGQVRGYVLAMRLC